MVFSSMIFLWAFLPVVWLVGSRLPLRLQNGFLLCASLLFYAWGEPKYLLLMLVSVTLNYLAGLLMAACPAGGPARAWVLAGTVLVNLGLLGYFKYYSFVADTLASLLRRAVLPPRQIALPIGISFYTFQAMSYCIDLYRGRIEVQRSWPRLALYISFFPQLIAGPIVRYQTVEHQLGERRVTAGLTVWGVKRFLYGLAKKLLLANAFAARADEIFGLSPTDISTPLAWLGTAYYMLQLYYDFSGYSDMAIGLGALFGFRFGENFRYPLVSSSISEFWRRWHISLSSWFSEYVYIPLGGNRKGKARALRNLFVVMLLSGLWHGANWQFVAWGAWNGAFLVLERLFLGKVLEKLPRPLRHAYTAAVFLMAQTFFRAPGLRAAVQLLARMVLPAAGSPAYPALRFLGVRDGFFLLIGGLLCGVAQSLFPRLREELFTEEAPGVAQSLALLGLGFLCVMQMVSSTYNPFIYFRF